VRQEHGARSVRGQGQQPVCELKGSREACTGCSSARDAAAWDRVRLTLTYPAAQIRGALVLEDGELRWPAPAPQVR